jgi:NAD(P)-dependent dehydrogenase (short-subunit alcohol dehydrogenase family)
MGLGLTEKAVLLTAGSSGLGKASAMALARGNANVAICGRNAERLETAREELNGAGSGDVLAVQTDLTDPDDLDELIEEVTGEFGGLDHLVYSTGAPVVKSFGERLERDWYTSYDLLVMSLVWMARRTYPFLCESDPGSLTVIASIEAREPDPAHVLSSVIRRAVPGLVKTLARDWAPDVRVNAVLVGPHDTPGFREQVDTAVEHGRYDSFDEGVADARDTVPLGCLGDPKAFGDVIAVLASQSARFITGAAIPVDGGVLRS